MSSVSSASPAIAGRQRGCHRLEDEAQRPDVDGLRAARGAPPGRRRGPGRAPRSRPCGSGRSRRRPSSSSATARVVGASVEVASARSTPSAFERFAEHRAEPIGREPADERDVATEPPDRPGRVEGSAAGDGREATVRVQDEVDEGLARHDDHAIAGTLVAVWRWARSHRAGGHPDDAGQDPTDADRDRRPEARGDGAHQQAADRGRAREDRRVDAHHATAQVVRDRELDRGVGGGGHRDATVSDEDHQDHGGGVRAERRHGDRARCPG